MPSDELPSPGLGTYNMTDAECSESIERAIEVGYRHIDAAQKYGNEAAIGEAISEADVKRDELFVATKVFEENLAHNDVLHSTQLSLERLGLECVDLLYVHWPAKTYDANETLSAFNKLVGTGLIERVGVCNFSRSLLEEAQAILDAPIFAHQIEMHPLLKQRELHRYAVEQDHYLVAYSPLIRGEIGEIPELRAIAKKHEATPAQVSLSWLMQKENVVPIPKATGKHIDENYGAWELTLDVEDIQSINDIERTKRVIDPPGMGPWDE